MVVNTDFAIAFRSVYGKYALFETNLFNFTKIQEMLEGLKIVTNKNHVDIEVLCPICLNIHKFSYSISEIMGKQMIIGGCDSVGIPIFYSGKSVMIINKVKRHNEINKEINAMI